MLNPTGVVINLLFYQLFGGYRVAILFVKVLTIAIMVVLKYCQ